MPIEYQKWITRQDLRNHPNNVYVFGDNLEGVGYGGQAAEMRGEPNAVGIPTKVSPSTYLDDGYFLRLSSRYNSIFFTLKYYLRHNQTIVWPANGIGTGLAKMEAKAPKCWALLSLYVDWLSEEPYENFN